MRKFLAFGFTCLLFLPAISARAQDDWEQNTTYYEDDAWYDISEWFDGNDYNPTDEVAGRWDDEIYSAQQDTGSDLDSDNWYGYDTYRTDDNWFYDYYDYYPDQGRGSDQSQGSEGADAERYDYASAYYDFDGDGYYDSYTYGVDRDGDGHFDSTSYYRFNDEGQNREQQARQNAGNSSQVQQVAGTIQRIKNVHVGNRQHILLEIQDKQGQRKFVDVGRGMKLEDVTLKKGNRIHARGPQVKVGDRSVVVARHLESGGRSTEIDRSGRTFRGEIAGTRTQKVRGVERQLVILMNPESRTKRIVDLGPADRLNLELREGDQISVTGVPVKIGDRRLVLANRINVDDRQVSIDRRQVPEQRTGRSERQDSDQQGGEPAGPSQADQE